jgi:hypothetical protein
MGDRRRTLVTVWLTTALVLGGLLVVAQVTRGPLDDPDQAHQRPGFLDAGHLPTDAPAALLDGVTGRPSVAFFVRPSELDDLCAALLLASPIALDAVVVVVTDRDVAGCDGLPVLIDTGARLAENTGLRAPADGGYPVGYAVIDEQDRIRYRTLDPGVAGRLDEVETIVGAVR